MQLRRKRNDGSVATGVGIQCDALLVSGSPEVSGSYPVTITATNPSGTDPQNHQFSIYDPGSFAAKMEMALTGATAGEDPGNLPGLLVRLDASSLTEANGSVLSIWPDASGSGHPLDQARGFPKVGLSAELGGKKVVRFDGFSQLYSTYDFGSTLNSYSVLALARHCGDANGTVVGSVGSGWVFGWGNDSSSYWKMGSVLTQSVPADSSWHLWRGLMTKGRPSLAGRGQSLRASFDWNREFHSQTFGLGWFRCQRLLLAIGSCGSFVFQPGSQSLGISRHAGVS